MRGPKPQALTLTKRERNELEALVRRHSTPQQLAKRGRIVLLAHQGQNNSQIARELGICLDRVRAWRMRWIGLQGRPPNSSFDSFLRTRYPSFTQ